MRLPGWLSLPLLHLAVTVWAGLSPLEARADIVVAVTSNLNRGPILRGAERAVDVINESGGLLGQELRLVSFDGGCDQHQSQDLANRVLKQGPSLVVGLECSDGTIAAAPIYDRNGIVQISVLSTNPRLTEMGLPATFRLLGRDDAQASMAVEMIGRKWRNARIALILDETIYGRDLAHYAREALSASKIDTALELEAKSGARSFADVVVALKREKIDLAYVTFHASRDLGLLMRELRNGSTKVAVMSGDIGAGVGRWVGGADNPSLLFTYCRQLPALAADHPLASVLGGADIDLNSQIRRAYAAVEVWAEAVRISGSLQSRAVAETLHTQQFATPIGPVSFDRKGDLQGLAAEWQWYRPGDGRMVPVRDSE